MHPILFKFHRIVVYTYGLCVAIGALLGMGYIRWQGVKIPLTPKQIYDLVFYVLVSGLIGARLCYVIINIKEFDQFVDIFKIWEGGLVFYGGLIGGFITFIILLKLWKINFFAGADVFAPALMLAHSIGRIGCFFAGCCYGSQTSLPWGITFTNPFSLAPLGAALQPTQIYAAAGNFIIFIFLHIRSLRKKYHGEILLWYIILYGIFRFCVEIFRADSRGPEFLSMTIMQYFSLFIAGAGIILMKKGMLKHLTSGI
ncbi:MAG: prolipoprotein diacylglyceryl transferase [bacterium]